MPTLSRLFPAANLTHLGNGDNGDTCSTIITYSDRTRAIHLNNPSRRDTPGHQVTRDDIVVVGPRITVQESYQLHGMALPQTMDGKRRTESMKKKDKSTPSRTHSRSFSNFFGSGKKKVLGVDSDTDSSDEEGFGISSTGSSSASKGKRALSARDNEPSFETGTCMTCHSKVRWPKGLKLYRCTVCYCVNDLEARPSKELRRVKDIDQATWHRLNARYPNLKFPDAPYFALAAREARDIADRCMRTYLDGVNNSDSRVAAPGEVRRPSADAGTGLNIPRNHFSAGTERRPSAGTIPPLPSSPLLSTPPHLTDVINPFNALHVHNASPESTASPKDMLPPNVKWNEEETRSDGARQATYPPAPVRRPPPPPDNAKEAPSVNADTSQEGGHTRKASWANYRHVRNRSEAPGTSERLKAAFTPLEVYLKWSYASFDSLNYAFSTTRRPATTRSRSEGASALASSDGNIAAVPVETPAKANQAWYLSEVNGKTLLVGDVAENATFWTGVEKGKDTPKSNQRTLSANAHRLVTHRSPCIHWDNAREWYHAVLDAGLRWRQRGPITDADVQAVQSYLQKLLLKASESLLRRPGKPLSEPEDIRFLMVMLANPLLYSSKAEGSAIDKPPAVCKRLMGLLARSGKRALRYLDGWLVNINNEFYQDLLSLCKRYMQFRLSRDVVPTEEKKDTFSPAGMIEQEAAHKHTQQALANIDGDKDANLSYFDDWGLGSAGAFMFSLWNANLSRPASVRLPCNNWYNLFFDSMGEAAIKQDFKAWESRKPTFAFCYFPFLISMSAKITILTFDANRQQMDEARKAWHQQFNTAELVSQNFHVHVRRECLAIDSLRAISEAAGSASHHKELKKGLRIHFKDEEGVDAGGLRKEFFLLLLRELLDPRHGLVEYDEQSNYCYFNPNSFEDSAQYFLLGTLIGLAIYNGTILDIPFPPFLFKKLLRREALASNNEGDTIGASSNAMDCSLEDLMQWRPSLARGFRQLLEYDGNVEADLALTFAAEIDRYGQHTSMPLAGNTVDTPVTNDNRDHYVRAYMQYVLHDSVSRQFEPFKRGFFAVCGGNALSLFQPEELELLVRGSDEALDINVLKAVSAYEGWSSRNPAENVPVIAWFWEFFASLDHKDQRKLLGFITGSDRVPALGEANLIIKLQCAGEDSDRLPVARTCFNVLQLYTYSTEAKLREKLWQAVTGSEGFLLK